MKKIFLITVLFLAPFFVEASTARFELDTLGVKINAVEGTLVLPEGLDVEDVQIGGSSILIWLEQPKVNDRLVAFSGIIPGGLSGKINILSLVGEFDGSELLEVRFTNIRALNALGDGGEVIVRPRLILVSSTAEDTESPVSLDLAIARSKEVFDNKYFVSFLAQDKGVGVSHYEFAYKIFGEPKAEEWVRVESPYQLSTKSLFGRIYIKSVDSSGNERVASMLGPYHFWRIIFWGIILVLLSCVLIYPNRLRSFFSSR